MPRLPKEVLIARIKNEIAACQRKLPHKIEVLSSLEEFPIKIRVYMVKTPGPIWKDKKVTHLYNHQFRMEITEDYPYEKPVIRWESRIFHPNIMLPEDGGYVCSKLLDDWDFSSNLLSFIEGIESLLSNPNPMNPYGSKSCYRAAQYFYKNPYNPPLVVKRAEKGPKIVAGGGSEGGEEKDQ